MAKTTAELLTAVENAATDVETAFAASPPSSQSGRENAVRDASWKVDNAKLAQERFFVAKAYLDVALAEQRRLQEDAANTRDVAAQSCAEAATTQAARTASQMVCVTWILAILTAVVAVGTCVQACAAYRQSQSPLAHEK
jgi:hypothetical protein